MYFNSLISFIPLLEKDEIFLRKRRSRVKGFINIYKFKAGDILKIIYFRKSLAFTFEGICLSIKGRKFLNPNSSFILRNIIMGIGLEIKVSFYYNRVYTFFLQDYKRKLKSFYKAKLYFIRYKKNKYSRVKN